jgi:hypothetical protein
MNKMVLSHLNRTTETHTVNHFSLIGRPGWEGCFYEA